MFYFLTSRQPLLCTGLIGLCAVSLIPALHFNIRRASAETLLAVGEKVSNVAALANLPDGQHQFCSEPEPERYLGAGTCYWFNKSGAQMVGYYGIPHSDIFVDCISGTIQDDKVVGEALALFWAGSSFTSQDTDKPITWKTLILGPGSVEYQTRSDRSELAVVKFSQAELTLRDFYRYSSSKMRQMKQPPRSCSVQEWIREIASR